jgi:hypothetical protein
MLNIPGDIGVSDIRDLTWVKYSEPGIFESVRNLAKFRLVAKVGYVGRWQGTDEPRKISQKLYYYLLGTLSAAGFHDPQRLEIYYQERLFRISYNDPEYGFRIAFNEAGWIEVDRDGSSLERFHEWYVKIMPLMQGIVNTLKSSVNEEINRSAEYLNLQQASYEFQVIAYNFHRSNAKRRSTNMELMKRALTLLPDDNGRLADSSQQQPEAFGRVNYLIGRWVGTEQMKRREVYEVSAPSNNEWSSLWFTFNYIGDSYTSPEGARSPFNDKDFVSARGALAPYVDFLRNRALCGFVTTLTEGYAFITTPDILP